MNNRPVFLTLLLMVLCLSMQAAFLTNVPYHLVQPNGNTLHCFATGDEFYARLHDAEGYTIVQNPQTGYYVYAIQKNGKIVPSDHIAGTCNPAAFGLTPNLKISEQEYNSRREAMAAPPKFRGDNDPNKNRGLFNNLVVFIRFADDSCFSIPFSNVNPMFNDSTENYNSLYNYYKLSSYNQLFVTTHFFPQPDNDNILSYQDIHPRNHYVPWSETNPDGYVTDSEKRNREFDLITRAIRYIENMVPDNLNIDYNNDGFVDNLCIVLTGTANSWSDLLWPHRWSLYDREVTLNGKRVYDFNLQLSGNSSQFNTSVLCHELFHTLGAPDLYHYDQYEDWQSTGNWDLMSSSQNPPQQTCSYMKYKYGNWINEEDIVNLENYGRYTIHPLTSSSAKNCCYRFQTQNPDEYVFIDFRYKDALFDSKIPGSGIVFYRVNTKFRGNASYNGITILDEIYYFRSGGSLSSKGIINAANFRENIKPRSDFSPTTDPYPFTSSGQIIQLHIGNFKTTADSAQFDFIEIVDVPEYQNAQLMLYPNPARNTLTVCSSLEGSQTYQIYNLYGQLLDVIQTQDNIHSIDISTYPNGCYFIKLFENQNPIKTIKFFKQ